MKNGPFIDDLSESIMILPVENGDFPVRYGKNPEAKSSQNYPHGPRGTWIPRSDDWGDALAAQQISRSSPVSATVPWGSKNSVGSYSAGPWKPK
jgi:hypothetical protein